MTKTEQTVVSAIVELSRSFDRIAEAIDRLTKAHESASNAQVKSMETMLLKYQASDTDTPP